MVMLGLFRRLNKHPSIHQIVQVMVNKTKNTLSDGNGMSDAISGLSNQIQTEEMPVVTLIFNTINSAFVILELVLFWWGTNSHLIIVESNACSDKKSGLSTLIGFHQKMQQPLNLQLCVFPLPKFWQQSIREIKGTFLHADLTKNNLTKSLPYSDSLPTLLLLYHVLIPYLQSSVRFCF